MDPEMTALNCIVAVAPEKARIPIVLPTDRAALEAAMRSIGLWTPASVRLAWIVNTSELRRMLVSPALAEEARQRRGKVFAEGLEFPFDAQGELKGLREVFAEHGAPS
jgi:hypothetical protein